MLRIPIHPATPPRYAVLYDPATMAIVATAATVVSGAIGAAGAISQGQASQNQARAQAAIYSQKAASERQAAAAREGDFRAEQNRLMARRRALLGGSGVDPSTGSPLLTGEDLAGEIELQALRIRHGGAVSATRLQQQAALTRAAGSAEAQAGFWRGGSLLLGTAAESASLWAFRGPATGTA